MMSDYIPISCHFYDELESLAVKRTPVEILFKHNNEEKCIEDLIVDFRTHCKEEFVILKSGTQIRLDQLLKVNGKEPEKYC